MPSEPGSLHTLGEVLANLLEPALAKGLASRRVPVMSTATRRRRSRSSTSPGGRRAGLPSAVSAQSPLRDRMARLRERDCLADGCSGRRAGLRSARMAACRGWREPVDLSIILQTDPEPTIEATASGHTVTYRPTADEPPAAIDAGRETRRCCLGQLRLPGI